MYRAEPVTEESERTAFRKAEKKYKIYYDNAKKKKIPRPVDLSEVIDFRSILESFKRGGDLPAGVFELKCDFNQPVFGLVTRPGFYFIPAALSIEEQCHWIRESLTSFPQPPNRTNHNAIYGPVQDLFLAAKEGKVYIEEVSVPENVISEANLNQRDVNAPHWKYVKEFDESFSRDACKSVSASVLLRKLRWSTLGLQFDWSKRSYNIDLPHKKIPDKLCMLAKRMAAPAMPCGEEFHPEAAIVNYFGLGDMLGGHLDDMEKDWSKPIVSIREHTPIAMFLRSGDAVLMAGEARECFHGVPRIFTDPENAEIIPLESQFSDEDNLPFLDYIRTSRININIRQVF